MPFYVISQCSRVLYTGKEDKRLAITPIRICARPSSCSPLSCSKRLVFFPISPHLAAMACQKSEFTAIFRNMKTIYHWTQFQRNNRKQPGRPMARNFTMLGWMVEIRNIFNYGFEWNLDHTLAVATFFKCQFISNCIRIFWSK